MYVYVYICTHIFMYCIFIQVRLRQPVTSQRLSHRVLHPILNFITRGAT